MKFLFVIVLMEFLNVNKGGNCKPSPSQAPVYKYEEYVIEHEISSTQAKNNVLHINLDALISPVGCKECTTFELNYCLSKKLIEDHCCCDKRYHEDLSFVPHTCYMGDELCKPYVEDCWEYTRLRSCCCDKNVIKKWKDKSNSSTLPKPLVILIISIILNL